MKNNNLLKLIKKNPDFEFLPNGKSKNYKNAKDKIIDENKYLPYLVENFLFCNLTKLKLAKRLSVLEKHVNGKKFKKLKEISEKNAEKKNEIQEKKENKKKFKNSNHTKEENNLEENDLDKSFSLENIEEILGEESEEEKPKKKQKKIIKKKSLKNKNQEIEKSENGEEDVDEIENQIEFVYKNPKNKKRQIKQLPSSEVKKKTKK